MSKGFNLENSHIFLIDLFKINKIKKTRYVGFFD